ncbi:hypothetical protein [Nocardioides sp. B-3]|uniref:hypothetical protein n=1 Tax=Nocardioides sp. B-3 TaxID=2895565 RepID=UPI003FA5CE14
MREVRSFDGLMIVHAEDTHAIDHAPSAHGETYVDFLRSRPRGAENLAVAQVIELARWTGCRVHVLHVSSSDVLPMLASARRDGVRITAETCPHYLTFEAEEIPDGATQFKCCPPIREAANRELLWDGLRDGVIDSGRDRPLAVDDRPQVPRHRRLRRRPGAASPRSSSASAPCGPRPADAASPPGSTWPAGCARRPPATPGCGARAGSRSASTPTSRSSPPTTRSSSTSRACITRTRSRRTAVARSPERCAALLRGRRIDTAEGAEPFGNLLTRGGA